jgi:hypothetical protein
MSIEVVYAAGMNEDAVNELLISIVSLQRSVCARIKQLHEAGVYENVSKELQVEAERGVYDLITTIPLFDEAVDMVKRGAKLEDEFLSMLPDLHEALVQQLQLLSRVEDTPGTPAICELGRRRWQRVSDRASKALAQCAIDVLHGKMGIRSGKVAKA